MMVITDMAGEPVTEILNPCPWFSEHSEDPALLATCLADWRQLADDPDFETRFCTGPLEFECARAFIRIVLSWSACWSPADLPRVAGTNGLYTD